MRVLIADDHQLMVEGTKRALEGAKEFEIVGEATNGAQVLPLVKRLRPDLVLLDLRDRVQAVVLAYETGLFDTDARPPSNLDERAAR